MVLKPSVNKLKTAKTFKHFLKLKLNLKLNQLCLKERWFTFSFKYLKKKKNNWNRPNFEARVDGAYLRTKLRPKKARPTTYISSLGWQCQNSHLCMNLSYISICMICMMPVTPYIRVGIYCMFGKCPTFRHSPTFLYRTKSMEHIDFSTKRFAVARERPGSFNVAVFLHDPRLHGWLSPRAKMNLVV
jgi:hypothetical protein